MLIPLKQKTWDLQKYQDDGFHDLQKKWVYFVNKKIGDVSPNNKWIKIPKQGELFTRFDSKQTIHQ